MKHERRKELLKVVLAQVEKGNKMSSAILMCSSDSEERKNITRALEACIPIMTNGRRAASSAAEYDRKLAEFPSIRMTWVRRAIKIANGRYRQELQKAAIEAEKAYD